MKYEYMKESEQMLQYFQFPKFLLKLRISQTAKFLYMILYDRARRICVSLLPCVEYQTTMPSKTLWI